MDTLIKDEPLAPLELPPAAAELASGQVDAGRDQLSKLTAAARDETQKHREITVTSQEPSTGERMTLARALVPLARRVATLAIAVVAVLSVLAAWDHYLTAPWTRDGRVRVQVANVAPQVSGQIKELRIVDNQFVHKGDILYVIDPFDFQVTLRTNTAQLKQKAADVQVKAAQSERRRHLSNLATTPEEQQIYAGNAIQAKAAFEAAQQQVSQAEINLNRTQVRSPVNGYVTNLLMRVGDYAHTGVNNVSIIDTDSYWIDGYFEETKMPRVCVGERVEAQLMGYSSPIIGHVATVTRGISVSNATPSTQGLPNVDPVYTWVRLAQRVPVRIAIDEVPPGVPLVSGMTATVTIRSDSGAGRQTGFSGVRAAIATSVSDVVNGPSARPGCIPPVTTEPGTTVSLPVEEAKTTSTPEEINPGLAPGMKASPLL
jgi:RND family efflux transporter MFP subunit